MQRVEITGYAAGDARSGDGEVWERGGSAAARQRQY
jgi:hypothetical protein